jgi:hypothetical protein
MLTVANWTFLTNHARVLLCIAHDPGVRLRDIAASAGITERSAYGIVTDLTEAGYIVKQKNGRRNRYQIQAHLPLPEPTRRERTLGEVLALLTGTDPAPQRPTHTAPQPGVRAWPLWAASPDVLHLTACLVAGRFMASAEAGPASGCLTVARVVLLAVGQAPVSTAGGRPASGR